MRDAKAGIMTGKPKIGIVQGDPAGIGSELLVKLLLNEDIRERANILVIGDPRVFTAGEAVVGDAITLQHVERMEDINFTDQQINHIDLQVLGIESVPFAQVSAAGGRSSLEGLRTAFEMSRDGVLDGICFMPFNKESMHLGGNDFADELGFARDFFGVKTRASEFNVAHGMWNGRVTSHVPMKDVPGK